jgi:hypothetical protein
VGSSVARPAPAASQTVGDGVEVFSVRPVFPVIRECEGVADLVEQQVIVVPEHIARVAPASRHSQSEQGRWSFIRSSSSSGQLHGDKSRRATLIANLNSRNASATEHSVVPINPEGWSTFESNGSRDR